MRIKPLSAQERVSGWLAFAVIVLSGALGLALLFYNPPVRGQEKPAAQAQVLFDCQEIAFVIGAAVDFRDAGADLEKTVGIIRLRTGATPSQQDVIEREIRKAWMETQRRQAIISKLYKRCRQQMGDMGMNG